MKDTAVDHFKSRRGNCAQAVAQAWKEKRDPASNHTERFTNSGSGRAPEGFCGALHAARELSGSAGNKLTEEFQKRAGGHIACRDIRKNRIMPCHDCVAIAAELLETLS